MPFLICPVLPQKETRVHSQKRHRLDDASCGFYRPDVICQQVVSSLLTSSSCIKPVDVIKLHQVPEHQTCCNLIFADLLQDLILQT